MGHVMRIVNRQEDNRIMDENTLSHQNGAVLGGGSPQNVAANNMNNKTGCGEDGNVNANSTAQYTIPGVLHFLQHEWARFELERSQWDVDRAELQVIGPLLHSSSTSQPLLRRLCCHLFFNQVSCSTEQWQQQQTSRNTFACLSHIIYHKTAEENWI